MERSTVLPPLLHAVLDLRDSVQWGDPRTVSPEISVRHGVNPIGGSPVTRYTITMPDVHASVMALLFCPEFDTHLQVSSHEGSRYLGRVDTRAVNDASGGVTSPSLNPPTPQCSTNERKSLHVPATVPPSTARLLVCPDMWFHPTAAAALAVEECVLEGGGVTDKHPSCPVGFPNAHPSKCPASRDEAVVQFYFGIPVPMSKPRDFVCRGIGVEDLSEGDGSPPLQSMRRDAAGVSPGHHEAYASAVCSCSGVLPALKRHVRGGVVCSVVIEGKDKGTPGLVMDSFCGLDFGVEFSAASWLDRDMENFVSLARKIAPLFDGNAIDVRDKEAVSRAHAVAARERRRQGITAADVVGCGGDGLCLVQ